MNKPIVIYCITAYVVTWGIVLTAYFSFLRGSITLNQLNLIYNLGAIGPLTGALIAAHFSYGAGGARKVLRTFRFGHISANAWLLAATPVLFLLIGFLIYPLMAGKWYTFAETKRQFNLRDTMSYIAWALPFISYSVLEEFGWRGFLLPHLQEKFPAMKATLLLTIAWASWHFPFFLWRFQFSGLITIGFFVSIFIGAVILTAIFNLAKGSILPVVTFHLLNNIASALDKEYLVAVLGAGFVFVAMYSTRTYGTTELSDGKRVGNFYKR